MAQAAKEKIQKRSFTMREKMKLCLMNGLCCILLKNIESNAEHRVSDRGTGYEKRRWNFK